MHLQNKTAAAAKVFKYIPIHDTQRRKKKRKKVTVCFLSPHPMNGPPHLFPPVHVWQGVCEEKGPHNHPRRSRQGRLRSASGSTWLCLSPILWGDQLWSECGERQAQWCCCYKYASTSVSKWQLYSGPRTHRLGTVRASHSKKGKRSVREHQLIMYLCTCGDSYVARTFSDLGLQVVIKSVSCSFELSVYTNRQ